MNPRCPGGTTVFETVRFGRSRIPPCRSEHMAWLPACPLHWSSDQPWTDAPKAFGASSAPRHRDRLRARAPGGCGSTTAGPRRRRPGHRPLSLVDGAVPGGGVADAESGPTAGCLDKGSATGRTGRPPVAVMRHRPPSWAGSSPAAQSPETPVSLLGSHKNPVRTPRLRREQEERPGRVVSDAGSRSRRKSRRRSRSREQGAATGGMPPPARAC